MIFAIYCLNFCIDLTKFFVELNKILKNGGYFYVAFVEPSRAPLAKWQFDDYTFLKLYNKNYLTKKAEENGFKLISEVDRLKHYWTWNTNFYQRLLAKLYISKKFFKYDRDEYYQHQSVLLFKKIS